MFCEKSEKGAFENIRKKLFQLCNILAYYIKFNIHYSTRISRKDCFYIRLLKSIGYDSCSKAPFLYIKNGETDAVEANGTFFNYKMAELFWKFKTEYIAAFQFLSFCADRCNIHMSLNKMAIQATVH